MTPQDQPEKNQPDATATATTSPPVDDAPAPPSAPDTASPAPETTDIRSRFRQLADWCGQHADVTFFTTAIVAYGLADIVGLPLWAAVSTGFGAGAFLYGKLGYPLAKKKDEEAEKAWFKSVASSNEDDEEDSEIDWDAIFTPEKHQNASRTISRIGGIMVATSALAGSFLSPWVGIPVVVGAVLGGEDPEMNLRDTVVGTITGASIAGVLMAGSMGVVGWLNNRITASNMSAVLTVICSGNDQVETQNAGTFILADVDGQRILTASDVDTISVLRNSAPNRITVTGTETPPTTSCLSLKDAVKLVGGFTPVTEAAPQRVTYGRGEKTTTPVAPKL